MTYIEQLIDKIMDACMSTDEETGRVAVALCEAIRAIDSLHRNLLEDNGFTIYETEAEDDGALPCVYMDHLYGIT